MHNPLASRGCVPPSTIPPTCDNSYFSAGGHWEPSMSTSLAK